jgi:hypothetical protein
MELRQYTLKAGCRDVLIDLFDRYFVERRVNRTHSSRNATAGEVRAIL